MRELFIYYRIEVAGAGAALSAVRNMQQRLCERHPGLAARLLRRPDEPTAHENDTQTWMEIYSLDDVGVSPALQAEIESEATALAAFIAGPRHCEVFVPCAS